MNIVSIFTSGIYAIGTDENNTYRNVLDQWNNPEYIYNFYKRNESLILKNIYIRCDNYLAFSELVMDCAERLDEDLRAIASGAKLIEYFEYLTINQQHDQPLSKWKRRENLLRLYAIKIDENTFLITGGAIKLTQKMQDHPDTNLELQNLERYKNILIENRIHDIDSFFEYIND